MVWYGTTVWYGMVWYGTVWYHHHHTDEKRKLKRLGSGFNVVVVG
jgi:hypothetical protein